ncbi:hypothetical protein NC652_006166 [Populus alba x Populus x berolinensis]|nr:hypothetical protein NC652_006166 [Populus alba x Populus x berolinensis]
MKYNCGLTRSIGIWTMRSLAFVANLSAELFEVSSVLMFKLQFNHMV